MTRKEARRMVPKTQVQMVVDAYHVGTPQDEVVDRIGKLVDSACKRNGLEGIAARRWRAACIEYAKRRHESNRVQYVRVMNPLVSANSARKIARSWP